MSYLSTALQRQTERRRLSQADLARGAELSRSFISRLFSGEIQEISTQNFAAVLKVFATDQQTQADLIAAHCMDTREAIRAAGTPGANLVEITVKGAPSPDKRPDLPQVNLSADTERAFTWLRTQCPVNPDLEKHLVGYAKLMGMK